MLRIALPMLLAMLPLAVQAQSSTAHEQGPPRWQVGVGAAISDSPYVGEGTRTMPVPWISYENERFFWRGVSGGWHAFKTDSISVDLLLAGRLDGFDISDLSRNGLMRNGLDPALLEDRDHSLDAGVSIAWKSRAGEVKLRALADVTDASGGYEVSLEYGYPWRLGRTLLIPGVGVQWLSSDLAGYYYGTLEEEEARGVTAYRPGSALVPELKLGVVHPLGTNWRLFGSLGYKFLPSELSDSPFLEPDSNGVMHFMIGVSHGF
jgi:outer membrane protein